MHTRHDQGTAKHSHHWRHMDHRHEALWLVKQALNPQTWEYLIAIQCVSPPYTIPSDS